MARRARASHPESKTTTSALRMSVATHRNGVGIALKSSRCRRAPRRGQRAGPPARPRSARDGKRNPPRSPKRNAEGKALVCSFRRNVLYTNGVSGDRTAAQSTPSTSTRISLGDMPLRETTPTRPPMLVPPTTSTGMRCSSSHWSTPMSASPGHPAAQGEPNPRPRRPRLRRRRDRRLCQDRPRQAACERQQQRHEPGRTRASARNAGHPESVRVPVYCGAGTIEAVARAFLREGRRLILSGLHLLGVEGRRRARVAAGNHDRDERSQEPVAVDQRRAGRRHRRAPGRRAVGRLARPVARAAGAFSGRHSDGGRRAPVPRRCRLPGRRQVVPGDRQRERDACTCIRWGRKSRSSSPRGSRVVPGSGPNCRTSGCRPDCSFSRRWWGAGSGYTWWKLALRRATRRRVVKAAE